MNCIEKKKELKSIIEEKLTPLIDNDYVLYGLPYYNNIGDTLIWEGELEFLKRIPHKCVGVCGWNTYPSTQLPENIIILITGGGYFGDLWRNGWDAVLSGIAPNKRNKIIILPNTIYYCDERLCKKDSEYLAEFPNLTICARDKDSYDFAKKHFTNSTLLIPDMAFCMKDAYLRKWIKRNPQKKVLFFKRKDKEAPEVTINLENKDYEVHDWLPMESELPAERRFYKTFKYIDATRRINRKLPGIGRTLMFRYVYRPMMTKIGCNQLSQYRTIYTTRLHAMILGVMLGRDVVMIDNKFGKLSSFYRTWLTDCDNVEPYEVVD